MLKKLLLLFLFTVIFHSVYAKEHAMLPPVVSAAPVQLQSWSTEINAIGTLSASQGVTLKPDVDGRITAIYFHSGDYVKAGMPLVQLYPDILQAQLASAQAKVVLSRGNYERTLLLFKKKVFAQADLDHALATYRSDQANAANIQAQLNQTLIRAPFSGRLGLRLVNLGDYITTGQAITNLETLSPLRVDFSIPETDLNQLALNQTVKIHSRSYPNKTFIGIVYAFDSLIDPNTRTLAVRAMLPNKDQKLLPGSFVDVTLLTSKPQKYIVVPQTALSYAPDGIYVYKIMKGNAYKIKVTTGMRKGDNIAILTGLNPNDIIIVAGQMKIFADGTPVTVSK